MSEIIKATCQHPEDVRSMDGTVCLPCAEGRETTHQPVSIEHPTYIEVRCGTCDVLWPCDQSAGPEATRHMCGRCGYWTTERKCPTCGEVYAGPGRKATPPKRRGDVDA